MLLSEHEKKVKAFFGVSTYLYIPFFLNHTYYIITICTVRYYFNEEITISSYLYYIGTYTLDDTLASSHVRN